MAVSMQKNAPFFFFDERINVDLGRVGGKGNLGFHFLLMKLTLKRVLPN